MFENEDILVCKQRLTVFGVTIEEASLVLVVDAESNRLFFLEETSPLPNYWYVHSKCLNTTYFEKIGKL